MENYTRKAVRGAATALVFTFLAAIIAYLTRIVLARQLQPADYGLFYAVFTFIIFFLFFRDLGLGQALVKYLAEFKALQRYDKMKTAFFSVFSIQLGSSLIFAAAFFLLANPLAEHYFRDPQASSILKILIFYVLLSLLFIITKQVFQGFQDIFLYSSVEFSKNVVVFILIVLFSKLNLGVFAPVLAFVLVGPILFFIYLPFLIKKCSFIFRREAASQLGKSEKVEISKRLILFGIPVILTDVGGQVVSYLDTILLTYFVSLEQVGIYNVVLPSALLFSFFSKAIGAVLFPLSSELSGKKDMARLSQGIALLHRYIFLLATPVFLTAIYYSQFFVTTLFGEKYASGYLALQILLVGVLFYLVASVNNNLIAGIGKPKTVTSIILGAALFNALFNVVFIPRFGIEGAAVVTAGSYLLMFLLSTYKVSRYLQSPIQAKKWFILLFPSISFLVTVSFVEKALQLAIWWEIILSAGAGLAVYGVLAYLFGLLVIGEIKQYLKLIFMKR